MITVRSARPDQKLEPFVRRYVHRQTYQNGMGLIEPVVARLGTMLEFQFARPYEIPVCGTNRYLICPRIAVIGPITYRRVELVIRDHVESLAVLFSPVGFHAIFGIPMLPLSDMGVEGHSVLGPEISALNERLSNVTSFPERTQLLDNFLIDHLQRRRTLDHVSLAFERMITADHPASVAELAQGNLSWTNVAHASCYYDQMHMIRDFRAFAGDSPSLAMEQNSPDHLISL